MPKATLKPDGSVAFIRDGRIVVLDAGEVEDVPQGIIDLMPERFELEPEPEPAPEPAPKRKKG